MEHPVFGVPPVDLSPYHSPDAFGFSHLIGLEATGRGFCYLDELDCPGGLRIT